MQGRLLMMPSSSQVLDHQLIFHIMYGLGQFHHRQNKGEERRGEIWQKSNSCLTNIERKMCKKTQLLLPKHRGQERQQKQRRGGQHRGGAEEGSKLATAKQTNEHLISHLPDDPTEGEGSGHSKRKMSIQLAANPSRKILK